MACKLHQTPGRAAALFLATLLLVSAPLAAERIKQPEFRRMNPEIMGQGGSYAAVAEGYSSLFTNPAGIALTTEPELTLPSATVWAHSRPDLLLSTIGAFSGDASDTAADGTEKSQEDLIIDTLREQFTTNGFGIGSALGTGYVGNRIGIGLEFGFDSYLYGPTFPLGLGGEINSRLALAVGYGYPFELGPVTLAVGGTLRPSLRASSFVDSDTAASLITQFTGVDTGDVETGTGTEESGGLFDTLTALNGWGVGFDAGVIAEYRPFRLGVQARNLFNTQMDYSNNSINEIIDAAGEGGLPAKPTDSNDPSYVSDTYVIPMEIGFGGAWQPDLGAYSAIFDPELHAQVTDPFKLTDQDRERARSFWTRLHFGTEMTFLQFFDLRFGINQGYFTMGTGLDLAFLEIQFAMYSQEYGRYPGDQQVGGAALEFALRC
ncbi:MAG: hypothetical protein PF508_13250 [Spirochaeta sp.]|nr:hypothetical protein [Spirochaeta sp.]